MPSNPRIALTMGDPAGIGPELCLRAAGDVGILADCEPVVFGSAACLRRVSEATGLPLPPASRIVDCAALDAGAVIPCTVQAACGRAAHAAIVAAVAAAVSGDVAAVVTAPIHKESLNLGGIPYPGHTELLRDLTGAERVCMMMASDAITVSLVSTHVAITDVPSCLTPEALCSAMRLTHAAMQHMGRAHPRLTVCGLNPHAGEHGLFGHEEADVILPVIEELRRDGMDITGPLPADTAFIEAHRRRTDAYICMYHDQGLIPFKMLAFDVGVNVTLGLPIIRTSVDHGTAFDQAWRGTASPASLFAAIRCALNML